MPLIIDNTNNNISIDGTSYVITARNNFIAAVPPTVNDDSTVYFSQASRWYDTGASIEYVCLDATPGAAVWRASGQSGYSGYSGGSFVGSSGYSGYSGISGYSSPGTSGYSGYSGTSGYSGYSGRSGYSGYSGTSGYSGYSGRSGYSGYSGTSGYSGVSGYSGATSRASYGAAYMTTNAATTTTITTAGTYYKIGGTTTAGILNNFTMPANNRLTYTGQETQDFLISLDLGGVYALNNTLQSATVRIAKNGTPDAAFQTLWTDDNGVTYKMVATLQGIVSLAKDDYVEAWMTYSTSGTSFIINTMQLIAQDMSGVGPIGSSGYSGRSGYSGDNPGSSGYSGYSGGVSSNDIFTAYGSSDASATTTSATYATRTTLTFTAPVAGNYTVHWSCEVTSDGATNENRIQLILDSATTFAGPIEGPRLLAGGGDWVTYSGIYQTNLTAASHNIVMQFATNSGTMSIRNARIFVRKAQ